MDFHVADDAEADEIREFQKRNITKSFIKRFLIVFAVVGVCVIFQMLARLSMPHMFGHSKPVSRLLSIGAALVLSVNFLSWLELMFESRVIFDIKKAKIYKVRIKKKLLIQHFGVLREKYRYIMCEDGEDFILDRIEVRGGIAFSNIREGQMVYIERTKDDGHYQYYLVA